MLWRTMLALLALAACLPLGAAAPPQLTIVAFGDSLTAGHGAPAGASYPDFLGRLLARDGFAGQVINRGVSGDTTTDGLARTAGVVALHPDWVILEFGGNDGLRGLPIATTRANLQAMIARLQRARIHILLAGMSLPPNYGADYIHDFQAIYRELAKRDQLPLLPFLYQDLVPRLRKDPALLQDDGIHATAAGNKIVAATVWRQLRPLLAKEKPRLKSWSLTWAAPTLRSWPQATAASASSTPAPS